MSDQDQQIAEHTMENPSPAYLLAFQLEEGACQLRVDASGEDGRCSASTLYHLSDVMRAAASTLRAVRAEPPVSGRDLSVGGADASKPTADHASRIIQADASACDDASVSRVRTQDGVVDRARDVSTDTDLPLVQGEPIAVHAPVEAPPAQEP